MVAAVTGPVVQFWDEVQRSAETSLYLQECRETSISENPGNFTFRHGLVFYRGWIVLPVGSSLATTVMKEYHDSSVGGHSRNEMTLMKIRGQFYWSGMKQEVKSYVASFETCHRVKASLL
ncbi:unnamed protein product [Linum trigynum]|uniref:Integrase zinc-binding domain-containing protein n=1 Tax=Linum trigynum TaxID=586398 RepID=A0AAV2E0S6_9ROSI